MNFDEGLLGGTERIELELRALYSASGYSRFKMSKFEEYDLYMKNKDFLISDGIITFNDTNGRLLALKPDVTLSIVKNSRDGEGIRKVYYNENVYRVSGSSGTYKEIMQTGLECIGDIGDEQVAEVVGLACESLRLIGSDYRMCLSHVGFVAAYLADYGIDVQRDSEICDALFNKKIDTLSQLCNCRQLAAVEPLMATYFSADDAKMALCEFCLSQQARDSLDRFAALWSKIFVNSEQCASVDFSVGNATGYYSGVVFKGFVSGVSTAVLSGGQYDGLMRKLSRSSQAIGFAVYLDELERVDSDAQDEYINVALPKGRLGEKVYAIFEQAGFECPSIKEQNRKLIFENEQCKVRYFWVKPSDVAIYVERGAADIGVAGYDILLEYEPDVYELCDLGLGRCRMAVAAPKNFVDDDTKTLRVATKFSNIAGRYYAQQGRDIDIIHLNGSIELAPILGLSDVIVDIVETGKTLLENNLEPRQTIVPISARLISNKSSYRFKQEKIEQMRKAIKEQVSSND